VSIFRDDFQLPKSTRRFVSADKDPDTEGDTVYWVFASRISEALGPEGGSMADIYNEVTRPLGLSLDDTKTLVNTAKSKGFLK
jgi:hypothetical protein